MWPFTSWTLIKLGILLLLLLVVLAIVAYMYSQKWINNRVQDQLLGKERSQPDIVLEEEDPDDDPPPNDDEEDLDVGYLSD